MKHVVSVLVAGLLATGCSWPEAKVAENAPPKAAPVALPLFTLRDPGLKEVAGLVASRRNQGLLWTAPRRGADSPVLEGVGADGASIARLHLEGVQRVDWADLAVGPGPDGRSTIFVGDIGDRAKIRPEVTVYRVTEPLVSAGADASAQPEVLQFRLAGGARDGGALLRDPLSNKLYIVAKEYGGSAPVFMGDALAPSGTQAVMEQVAQLKLELYRIATEESAVDAGDISMDGMRIALRTASSVIEWERDRNESVEKALSHEPARVITLRDPLAASLSYAQDASLMLALSGQVMRIDAMGAR